MQSLTNDHPFSGKYTSPLNAHHPQTKSPHYVSKRLANLDLLTGLNGELKPMGSLKDHNNCAPKLESTHFLPTGKRLPTEESRSLRVVCFDIRARWRTTPKVGAEILARSQSHDQVRIDTGISPYQNLL